MNTFIYHYKGFIETFQQLFKGKFLLYFIPGAIVTLIYWAFQAYTASVQESMMLSSDYSWIDWAYGYVNTGVKTVFGVFDYIAEQMYIFAVLTILSPFYTFLGEALDGELTGQKFKSTFIRFINDILRMIFIVIIALALEVTFFLGIWMLSWLPIIGEFKPIIYFAITAFFFGFAFYDFALERYKVNVTGSLWFAFMNPLTMLLTGSIFLGIYNIPIIGITIAPVITLMISTIVYLYHTKKLPKTSTELKESENE